MRIGIIGDGAIARFVIENAADHGHEVCAQLLRPERAAERQGDDVICVGSVDALPADIEHVVDCAGHSALRDYGADVLRGGRDLTTVSIGAMADQQLYDDLDEAAADGASQLHLASGAIGALDCLRAARVGKLLSVTYIGRKPALGWKGSPAEASLDLDALTTGEQVHFAGTARVAALEYPKNANVAAAVALAGLGFDDTNVQLIADAGATENIHQVRASGDFGSFSFEIRGKSLPDNPKSSALAAMSVLSKLEDASQRVVF